MAGKRSPSRSRSRTRKRSRSRSPSALKARRKSRSRSRSRSRRKSPSNNKSKPDHSRKASESLHKRKHSSSKERALKRPSRSSPSSPAIHDKSTSNRKPSSTSGHKRNASSGRERELNHRHNDQRGQHRDSRKEKHRDRSPKPRREHRDDVKTVPANEAAAFHAFNPTEGNHQNAASNEVLNDAPMGNLGDYQYTALHIDGIANAENLAAIHPVQGMPSTSTDLVENQAYFPAHVDDSVPPYQIALLPPHLRARSAAETASDVHVFQNYGPSYGEAYHAVETEYPPQTATLPEVHLESSTVNAARTLIRRITESVLSLESMVSDFGSLLQVDPLLVNHAEVRAQSTGFVVRIRSLSLAAVEAVTPALCTNPAAEYTDPSLPTSSAPMDMVFTHIQPISDHVPAQHLGVSNGFNVVPDIYPSTSGVIPAVMEVGSKAFQSSDQGPSTGMRDQPPVRSAYQRPDPRDGLSEALRRRLSAAPVGPEPTGHHGVHGSDQALDHDGHRWNRDPSSRWQESSIPHANPPYQDRVIDLRGKALHSSTRGPSHHDRPRDGGRSSDLRSRDVSTHVRSEDSKPEPPSTNPSKRRTKFSSKEDMPGSIAVSAPAPNAPDPSTSNQKPKSPSSHTVPDSSITKQKPENLLIPEVPDSSASGQRPEIFSTLPDPDSSASDPKPDIFVDPSMPDSSASGHEPESLSIPRVLDLSAPVEEPAAQPVSLMTESAAPTHMPENRSHPLVSDSSAPDQPLENRPACHVPDSSVPSQTPESHSEVPATAIPNFSAPCQEPESFQMPLDPDSSAVGQEMESLPVPIVVDSLDPSLELGSSLSRKQTNGKGGKDSTSAKQEVQRKNKKK